MQLTHKHPRRRVSVLLIAATAVVSIGCIDEFSISPAEQTAGIVETETETSIAEPQDETGLMFADSEWADEGEVDRDANATECIKLICTNRKKSCQPRCRDYNRAWCAYWRCLGRDETCSDELTAVQIAFTKLINCEEIIEELAEGDATSVD